MKKLIIALVMLALVPVSAMASGGSYQPHDSANVDLTDQAALQRGAKFFTNYCLGCHSLKYERWQRMEEFGLTIDQIKEYLMPAGAKPGDLMTIAMDPANAAAWFGAPAPDLTLETRLRGEDWVYNYLRAFYIDESRPFGVNNTVFDKVGMPHVLWELQGMQKAIFDEEDDGHGGTHKVFKGFEQVSAGTMTPEEYDAMSRDLVTFLAYMAEPVKLERQRLGIYVLIFLAFFFVVAYMLKKNYWKDVH